MSRPESFSAAQVAKLLGVGKPLLIQQIKKGRLKAARVARGTERYSYRISRSALTQYAMAINFPLDHLRRLLNPSDTIILCCTSTDLQRELSAKVPTRYVGSLLDLGRAIEAVSAWGIIVDLPEVGTAEACRSLRPLYLSGDRPKLIGLVGDDGIVTESPIPFDTILPANSDAKVAAKSVLTLRRRLG